MPTQAPVIPSPADAVKANLAAAAVEAGGAAPGGEVVVAPGEVKKEEVAATKPDSLAKALSGIADPAVEVKKEVAKPEELEPEALKRNDGENDSSYIKRIKASNASHITELATLRTQLEAAKKTSLDPEQLKTVSEERDQLMRDLEMHAYQLSPAFKREYQKPLTDAVEDAKSFITDFSEGKGVYERALVITDPKERKAFLKENMEDGAANAFDKLTLVDRRQKAMSEAVTGNAAQAKQYFEQSGREQTEATLKSFDAMRADISKNLAPFRGEQGEALYVQARALLSGEASSEDILAAAYLAAAAPSYIQQGIALAAENATLKARIAAYEGSTPGVRGGSDNGSRNNGGEVKIENGKVPSIGDFNRGLTAART